MGLLKKLEGLVERKKEIERPLKEFLEAFIVEHRADLKQLKPLLELKSSSGVAAHKKNWEWCGRLGLKNDFSKFITGQKDIIETIFTNPNAGKFLNEKERKAGALYLRLKKIFRDGLKRIGFTQGRGIFALHTWDHELLRVVAETTSEFELLFGAETDVEKTYLRLRREIYKTEYTTHLNIIVSLLGENFKAVYWCPSGIPFDNEIAPVVVPVLGKKGKWHLVDASDLSKDLPHLRRAFRRYVTIQFDIRKTPNFPDNIKPGTFDLSFYQLDWAGNNSTHIAADLALRIGGIIMTKRQHLKEINQYCKGSYKVLFDPEREFTDFALFLKEK